MHIKSLTINNKIYSYYNVLSLSPRFTKLPYTLLILLENIIRHHSKPEEINNTIKYFENWIASCTSHEQIDFYPSRVLMQDFTGVPAIVDLAALRNQAYKLGKDPLKINPVIPVDLVIDHSIQVDHYASDNALRNNEITEVQRNIQRYEFLKWGERSFENFRVIPPGKGICHQINIEYLSTVVSTKVVNNQSILYPDTLVGTDSHTTMANGLGVLGWGVGGIEAEAAMLGQPISMVIPEVVNVNMKGRLINGVTATDLVLKITQVLRNLNVVNKIIEFTGESLKYLTISDRATISNMAPEYGATAGFFPTDDETLRYLKTTGRTNDQISIVEQYNKAQGLWYSNIEKCYTQTIDFDLNSVEPSVAGPKRPQDRILIKELSHNFANNINSLSKNRRDVRLECKSKKNDDLNHGDIVIAAITSCTNTSNPHVMIAAGLLAKNAVEKGLKVKSHIKTSLAPGSQVVTQYLKDGGLDIFLNQLGFHTIGYGCTTCIGNSGPLKSNIEQKIIEQNLIVTSILSGNRNFEGRIHPLVRANYLASPPLVIAYALAGTINIDLTQSPLGKDESGRDIFLRDIWPSNHNINKYLEKYVTLKVFKSKYQNLFTGDKNWEQINVNSEKMYSFDIHNTYIALPPYFNNTTFTNNILKARILGIFGDSTTTDHISPAGKISKNTAAGQYLVSKNIAEKDFNSYGSRRGNHNIMMRGTFANVRIKNLLCNKEGGYTIYHPTQDEMYIYDAAMLYKDAGVPTVIFAGKEYGTGSSRDWAAKGTALLGVKAVIARSFERIHRSNLIGMGVMPLTYSDEYSIASLKLKGEELISIIGVDKLDIRKNFECIIECNGTIKTIPLKLEVYTQREIDYLNYQGILSKVLEDLTQ